MATKINRAIAVLNALKDPLTVTNPEAVRVAAAFAYTYARAQAGLTNEQKAGLFLLAVRDFVKGVVRDAEMSQALEVERLRVAASTEMDLGTDGGVV